MVSRTKSLSEQGVSALYKERNIESANPLRDTKGRASWLAGIVERIRTPHEDRRFARSLTLMAKNTISAAIVLSIGYGAVTVMNDNAMPKKIENPYSIAIDIQEGIPISRISVIDLLAQKDRLFLYGESSILPDSYLFDTAASTQDLGSAIAYNHGLKEIKSIYNRFNSFLSIYGVDKSDPIAVAKAGADFDGSDFRKDFSIKDVASGDEIDRILTKLEAFSDYEQKDKRMFDYFKDESYNEAALSSPKP